MRRPIGGWRRGSNAIEFAFSMPILMALLFGVIEYGTMFNRMLSVRSATRDGARWGATPAFTVDTAPDFAVEQVRDSLALLGISCTEDDQRTGACTVEAESDPLLGFQAITVTTTLVYSPITGGLLPTPPALVATASFVLGDQTPPEG